GNSGSNSENYSGNNFSENGLNISYSEIGNNSDSVNENLKDDEEIGLKYKLVADPSYDSIFEKIFYDISPENENILLERQD
ncbi:hypothetical protein PIROE2DRAFT_18697, partial [Piromyces sp. E2]